jgi:uroporphyrinogen-III decarboxylase
MPQYRNLRQSHSILDLCHNPELAAEVTLQPVERLGVDAAIIFADILLPFEPLRLGLSFAAGEGPHIERPIRDAADVERLPSFNIEAELGFVLDAIRLARRALPKDVPLIGFAGAPFTLPDPLLEPSERRWPRFSRRDLDRRQRLRRQQEQNREAGVAARCQRHPRWHETNPANVEHDAVVMSNL